MIRLVLRAKLADAEEGETRYPRNLVLTEDTVIEVAGERVPLSEIDTVELLDVGWAVGRGQRWGLRGPMPVVALRLADMEGCGLHLDMPLPAEGWDDIVAKLQQTTKVVVALTIPPDASA